MTPLKGPGALLQGVLESPSSTLYLPASQVLPQLLGERVQAELREHYELNHSRGV